MRIGMIVATAAIILALAGAALWWFFLREEPSAGHTDEITLVVPAVTGQRHASEPELLASMTMTGGTPDSAAFTFSLMDPDGASLPVDGGYTFDAALTNLNDGASVDALALEPVDGERTPTWRGTSDGVDTAGWWRVRAEIGRPDGDPLHAEFFLLIEDPNMRGFTAPPAPETDPQAETMLQTALSQMSGWNSLRWWEWLSAGDGSMILVEFSVTTPDANGQPPSFQNRSLFAGKMVPSEDGSPPATPRRDYYTAVTIGDQGWQLNPDGTPESRPATRYLPIQQYPETYEGATSVQRRHHRGDQRPRDAGRDVPRADAADAVRGVVRVLDRCRDRRCGAAVDGRDEPLHGLGVFRRERAVRHRLPGRYPGRVAPGQPRAVKSTCQGEDLVSSRCHT